MMEKEQDKKSPHKGKSNDIEKHKQKGGEQEIQKQI
jgi:hypothetical protein